MVVEYSFYPSHMEVGQGPPSVMKFVRLEQPGGTLLHEEWDKDNLDWDYAFPEVHAYRLMPDSAGF